MTSVIEKQFMAYMRSIDKSLGRIATALEDMQKQQEIKTYEETDDDYYDGCLRIAKPIDRDDLK